MTKSPEKLVNVEEGFVILPTVLGKSLIFQSASTVCK